MQEILCFNICKLETSYHLNSDLLDLDRRIEEHSFGSVIFLSLLVRTPCTCVRIRCRLARVYCNINEEDIPVLAGGAKLEGRNGYSCDGIVETENVAGSNAVPRGCP